MLEKDKKDLLKIKKVEDFYMFDATVCTRLRDEYYNQLLKDKEVKKHIQELFNISENEIPNILVINGAPPIDDFDDEYM